MRTAWVWKKISWVNPVKLYFPLYFNTKCDQKSEYIIVLFNHTSQYYHKQFKHKQPINNSGTCLLVLQPLLLQNLCILSMIKKSSSSKFYISLSTLYAYYRILASKDTFVRSSPCCIYGKFHNKSLPPLWHYENCEIDVPKVLH